MFYIKQNNFFFPKLLMKQTPADNMFHKLTMYWQSAAKPLKDGE